MRGAFAHTLVELAAQDPRVMLLTGDLGYNALEPFAERFPRQFINVGVAEQNMVGIATGLAEAGFIPFAYSITPFAALRPYEFFRNGAIAHQLPVRLVGMGGGFEYGPAGHSHFGLEDVGVMRLQPSLVVIAPADAEQTRQAMLETWNLPGPVYYRLGKDDKTRVPGLGGQFQLGRAQVIRQGADAVLIAMGAVASEAAAAAELLAQQGISVTMAIVASVSPAPKEELAELLSQARFAFTVEEHFVVGGLGSLVSEIVAEEGLPCRVRRCGVADLDPARSGSQAYLRARHGLTGAALATTVATVLERSE